MIRKILFKTVPFLLLLSVAHADCSLELFTISSKKGTKIAEFVDQLSHQCEYTVIIKDRFAQSIMEKRLNKLSLKKVSIHEVFDILLRENNLHYTLSNDILKISYIVTKTYNIDYILSQRKSEGSTDVSLSSSQDNLNSINSNTQGSDSNPYNAGKGEAISGVSIKSIDEVLFWEALDVELQQVLNRPEDEYRAQAPIINKNAGMITVSATATQLQRLDDYLKELQHKIQYQVMIDVHMFAISLDKGNSTGVNWAQLFSLQAGEFTYDVMQTSGVSTFTGGLIDTIGSTVTPAASLIRVAGGGSITDIVKFLETQGKVSAISNPKVLTLNNQPALITVGTEYFYKLSQSANLQGPSGGVSQTVSNELISSVFAGVLLDITPEISDEDTITLKINPSYSSTRDKISSRLADSAKRDMPPDLDRRQLSSVVTVKDRNKIILGGLITNQLSKQENQIPLLGDIPILGLLFSYEENVMTSEELIIIIEPHIIKADNPNLNLKELGYKEINASNMMLH